MCIYDLNDRAAPEVQLIREVVTVATTKNAPQYTLLPESPPRRG